MKKKDRLEMLDLIGRDPPIDKRNEIFDSDDEHTPAKEESYYDGPDRPTKQDEIESLRAQLAKVTQDLATAKGLLVEGRYLELYREGEEQKKQLLATQAHAARLVEALRLVVKCCDEPRSRDNSEHEGLDAMEAARSALSTPINLDALHEHDARALEEAKAELEKFGLHRDHAFRLKDMAAAHRAKKEGK